MKQNLIGLVWRNIPKMSQHKLSYSSNANDFENWCNETISDYQKLNIEYAILAKDETKFLNDLGCSKVVVVPGAVGDVRTVLFKKLISNLPEYSFVLLKSFEGFGNSVVLKDCMDLAVSQKIYIITEKHLSLMHFPNDVVDEVYYDWIRKNSFLNFSKRNNIKRKINSLIHDGLSPIQIQEKLGISKSSFYRLSEIKSISLQRNEKLKHLLSLGKSPRQIQQELEISNSTYYRLAKNI